MMASCGTVNQVCRKLSKLRKTVSNQKKNFIGKDGDPSEINPKERYCSLTNKRHRQWMEKDLLTEWKILRSGLSGRKTSHVITLYSQPCLTFFGGVTNKLRELSTHVVIIIKNMGSNDFGTVKHSTQVRKLRKNIGSNAHRALIHKVVSAFQRRTEKLTLSGRKTNTNQTQSKVKFLISDSAALPGASTSILF